MARPPFNLIREEWLPVRRADGSSARIAPRQLTDSLAENPIVAIDWPRPDFNGATLEFLIGLLATAFAPKDLDGWLDRWEQPPDPDELHRAFESIAFAFDLDGDGPRFMQETAELNNGQPRTTEQLLIDHPQENTRDLNRDLFVKRNAVKRICRSVSAIALYTVQTYSPGAGPGFRTSLRRGGPLTTLVVPPGTDGRETVWSRCWANTPLLQAPPNDLGLAFPWLEAPCTSENDEPVTQQMRHAVQSFWGMPRRIRLVFGASDGLKCDLTGWADEVMVVGWNTKRYGERYVGWHHPLSPYDRKAGQEDGALTGDRVTGFYRDWLGFVHDDRERGRHPAQCLSDFLARADAARFDRNFRVVAFGYHADNASAVRWHQSEMPVPSLGTLASDRIQEHISQIVYAAEHATSACAIAIAYCRMADYRMKWTKDGSFRPPPGQKLVKTASRLLREVAIASASDRFWASTERDFYGCAGRLEDDPDDSAGAIREDWLRTLHGAALAIFDDAVPSEGIENCDWRRMVEARCWLVWQLDGDDIRAKLGLRTSPARTKGRRRKGDEV